MEKSEEEGNLLIRKLLLCLVQVRATLNKHVLACLTHCRTRDSPHACTHACTHARTRTHTHTHACTHAHTSPPAEPHAVAMALVVLQQLEEVKLVVVVTKVGLEGGGGRRRGRGGGGEGEGERGERECDGEVHGSENVHAYVSNSERVRE